MNLKRLPLLLVSIVLAACGNYVVVGGGGQGNGPGNGNGGNGAGGGSGGNGNGGNGGSAIEPAVALTRAQLDILWDEYWANQDPSGSSVSVGGGGDLNPDDLFLRISDLGAS